MRLEVEAKHGLNGLPGKTTFCGSYRQNRAMCLCSQGLPRLLTLYVPELVSRRKSSGIIVALMVYILDIWLHGWYEGLLQEAKQRIWQVVQAVDDLACSGQKVTDYT